MGDVFRRGFFFSLRAAAAAVLVVVFEGGSDARRVFFLLLLRMMRDLFHESDDDDVAERGRLGEYSNDRAIEALSSKANNPWSVNVYHSKRKEHITNELGDIENEEANSGKNIVDQPGWDADRKLRFSITIISEELGLSEKQVEDRVGQLFTLIPGLKKKVGVMKTADLVRISAVYRTCTNR